MCTRVTTIVRTSRLETGESDSCKLIYDSLLVLDNVRQRVLLLKTHGYHASSVQRCKSKKKQLHLNSPQSSVATTVHVLQLPGEARFFDNPRGARILTSSRTVIIK